MVAPIKVLIVDEDPLAVRGTVAALKRGHDIVVVGTARALADGARLARELEPHVVLLDGRISHDSGDLRPMGTESRRRPQVLVLSTAPDEEAGLVALRQGAAGYLDKQVDPDALPRIVRALAAGELVLSRGMTATLVDRLVRLPSTGTGLRPVRSPLSTREWEVLDMLRSGASTRQIAEELHLTTETVRSHVKRVLRKLGAHTRAEAVEVAQRMMVRPSPPDAMAG